VAGRKRRKLENPIRGKVQQAIRLRCFLKYNLKEHKGKEKQRKKTNKYGFQGHVREEHNHQIQVNLLKTYLMYHNQL
jgi:hypothetical protein